jgi:hypothetical protein
MSKMAAVPKRAALRAAAVLVSVLLAGLALWSLRGITRSLSDGEVRHGVATRAVVLTAQGDTATVRIPLPDADVVTDIEAHRTYAAGDTVPVVYDPIDPARASEHGAPASSSPLSRGLIVAGLFVAGLCVCVAGSALSTRRSMHRASAVHAGNEVRGGRAIEPASTSR